MDTEDLSKYEGVGPLTIGTRLLLAIFDNSPMSIKEAIKYLRSVNHQSVYSTVAHLRNNGLIQHIGYARYECTERGKEAVGRLLKGEKVQISRKPDKPVPSMQEVLAQEAPAQTPPESSVENKPNNIDWQQQYINLTNKIVDGMFTRKEPYDSRSNT